MIVFEEALIDRQLTQLYIRTRLTEHVTTAIDIVGLAGDKCRRVAGQEGNRSSDIFRFENMR